MPTRRAQKAKTHVLKNTDLNSILEPANPNETAFTCTKGDQADAHASTAPTGAPHVVMHKSCTSKTSKKAHPSCLVWYK